MTVSWKSGDVEAAAATDGGDRGAAGQTRRQRSGTAISAKNGTAQ